MVAIAKVVFFIPLILWEGLKHEYRYWSKNKGHW